MATSSGMGEGIYDLDFPSMESVNAPADPFHFTEAETRALLWEFKLDRDKRAQERSLREAHDLLVFGNHLTMTAAEVLKYLAGHQKKAANPSQIYDHPNREMTIVSKLMGLSVDDMKVYGNRCVTMEGEVAHTCLETFLDQEVSQALAALAYLPALAEKYPLDAKLMHQYTNLKKQVPHAFADPTP